MLSLNSKHMTHTYQPSLKTQDKQVSCFSVCPWLNNGKTWSPSTILSPYNKRRCGHTTFYRAMH